MIDHQKIKIFCFPYAGGSARVYKSWQRYLPPEIELVPVEVKGRGKRYAENLADNMEEMVADVFQQIKDQLNETKYVLFGHSMGAVIAHELCYSLISKNLETPLHIFLTGREAPQRGKKTMDTEKTYLLPDDKFINKLKDYGGTPKEILENEELMNIFTPILRGDFRVVDTYQHRFRDYLFDFGITVMTGLKEDLDEAEINGWQAFTKQKLKSYKFPGGHFFIHESTFNILRIVCKTIFEIIEEGTKPRMGII